MRVCKIFVRALIVLAIACGVYTAGANAQTLTVSPTDLSFGVPTGTSPAVSAPQTVTINIQGQGPVNFTGTSTSNPDFAVNGNSCTGTLTAPTTCQVSVVFTSTQPAGTLEVATLTITSGASPGTLSVPMNGALGAIEFFGALNINPSLFSGVTWTNNPPTAGNPVSSNTVALACPAGAVIKATLSSTPDGKSNVFQDNTMRIINTTSGGTTTNTPNVCLGGDTNFQGYTGFPGTTNCFQGSYENAASSYIGQNPDLATSPINTGLPGSFLATYGVPVIDISGLLGPGTQALTIELDDAGGDLGAATLHLVTSCSLAGAVPGGTIKQVIPSTRIIRRRRPADVYVRQRWRAEHRIHDEHIDSATDEFRTDSHEHNTHHHRHRHSATVVLATRQRDLRGSSRLLAYDRRNRFQQSGDVQSVFDAMPGPDQSDNFGPQLRSEPEYSA